MGKFKFFYHLFMKQLSMTQKQHNIYIIQNYTPINEMLLFVFTKKSNVGNLFSMNMKIYFYKKNKII